MAQNNHIQLIGNMGAEARIITLEGDGLMAAFSLATQDSYKDEQGNWQKKDVEWHNVLCFHPKHTQNLKNLKKGTRIKVIGSLSYKDIKAIIDEGKEVTLKEAAVVANKIELAPLLPAKE